MQRLTSFFFPQNQSQIHRNIFVVYGLGGIGKTQLCVEFARKQQTRYSAVFWLDGSTKDAIRRSFVNVARKLPAGEAPICLPEMLAAEKLDMDSLVGRVLDWLSLPSNQRWLLVIDNVDRGYSEKGQDSQAYDVMRYCPKADHGNILITSRLSTLRPPQHSLCLGSVDRAQGLAILESTGGDIVPEAEPSDVDALLDLLSGLPLALTQAGAYMRQTGTTITRYLSHYRRTWQALMVKQDRHQLREYAQGSVQQENSGAASLLKLWAFLDCADLWYGLVACAATPWSDVETPDWLLQVAQDELEFGDAMATLLKYSLVDIRTQTEGYTMHAVLHSWCMFLLTPENEQAVFFKLACVIVGRTVPCNEVSEHWRTERRLLPHGKKISERLDSYEQKQVDHVPVWVFSKLGNLFASHDVFTEADRMYERALAGYEKALGPEHTSTLDTVRNLGLLYSGQGKLAEAEKMYERALAGFEKALGPKHTSILDTVRSLGSLYRDQSKLAEAEKMYERALAGFEKALGPEHTLTLTMINNLGVLYSDQSKLAEAEKMYERALAGFEKALGPKHTSILD
ncbi:hypothetical protein D6D29_05692, partial [Aureobasidium pullulans]